MLTVTWEIFRAFWHEMGICKRRKTSALSTELEKTIFSALLSPHWNTQEQVASTGKELYSIIILDMHESATLFYKYKWAVF